MTLKIVGSHLCPNTLYAIVKCKEVGIPVRFTDISASLDGMREFLALREQDEIYSELRTLSGMKDYVKNGRIGLPCFIFEDGNKTLNLDEAIEKAAVISRNHLW